jgi:hypothetical protein
MLRMNVVPHEPLLRMPREFQLSHHNPFVRCSLTHAQIIPHVCSGLKHLNGRITPGCVTVSPSIRAGSNRAVFSLYSENGQEGFVVKVDHRESKPLHHYHNQSYQPLKLPAWCKKHIAQEEGHFHSEGRTSTVAPLIEGATLLTFLANGIRRADWALGYTHIPALMLSIWRAVRDPDNPDRGLLYDVDLDNIMVGNRLAPFIDQDVPNRPSVVFIDEREDGLFHERSVLDQAIREYRADFLENVSLREDF